MAARFPLSLIWSSPWSGVRQDDGVDEATKRLRSTYAKDSTGLGVFEWSRRLGVGQSSPLPRRDKDTAPATTFDVTHRIE